MARKSQSPDRSSIRFVTLKFASQRNMGFVVELAT